MQAGYTDSLSNEKEQEAKCDGLLLVVIRNGGRNFMQLLNASTGEIFFLQLHYYSSKSC